MSETKFTPGPWSVSDDWRIEPWTDALNIMAGSDWIASTTRGFEGNGQEGNSSAVANAHLIAAAPALYEALFDAREIIEAHIYAEELLARFDAILKQARGEAATPNNGGKNV